MKLAIVIGATRPNRETPKQAAWVETTARAMDGVDPMIVDLKDYPMPFFNEPVSPRYNPERQIAPEVKKWLDKIEAFDAYIFVTPEYNHSIPAVLKNALDFITWELVRKPATVVSHGSAGGAQAATDLKEILSESRTAIIPSPNPLAISGMSDKIDESGQLSEAERVNPYGPQTALESLLADLKWYSDALAAARAQAQ